MDISGFVNWFIAQIVGLFAYIYSVLARISFNGVSLLEFFVYCLLIGIVIDLFIISVRARAVRSGRTSGKNSKNSKSDAKGGSDENK